MFKTLSATLALCITVNAQARMCNHNEHIQYTREAHAAVAQVRSDAHQDHKLVDQEDIDTAEDNTAMDFESIHDCSLFSE